MHDWSMEDSSQVFDKNHEKEKNHGEHNLPAVFLIFVAVEVFELLNTRCSDKS